VNEFLRDRPLAQVHSSGVIVIVNLGKSSCCSLNFEPGLHAWGVGSSDPSAYTSAPQTDPMNSGMTKN
jgi:hypothetical protein